MNTEDQKMIARAYIHALFTGDYDLVERYIDDEDCRRFAVETTSRMRELFPDIRVTIEDQISAGDKVVTRVLFHGTHLGAVPGIRPTGQKVTWQGIGIDRFAAGKIVEMWHEADTWGMMRQLGFV